MYLLRLLTGNRDSMFHCPILNISHLSICPSVVKCVGRCMWCVVCVCRWYVVCGCVMCGCLNVWSVGVCVLSVWWVYAFVCVGGMLCTHGCVMCGCGCLNVWCVGVCV